MIIRHICDELQTVQIPMLDIWRLVPTVLIFWCCTYLQCKVFFSTLHWWIPSLWRSDSSHLQRVASKKTTMKYNLLHTVLGIMVAERRAPVFPRSETAGQINSPDQQNTAVDSLPCPSQDWTATSFISTISHHLPHWVPLSSYFTIRLDFQPWLCKIASPHRICGCFLRYH